MGEAVVLTGMGCISGLGVGVTKNWSRALAGESAIRPIEQPGIAGVAAWIATEDRPDTAPWRRLGRLDPLSLYALVAATEAVAQAGLEGHAVLEERTAILLGCGSGGNATIDEAYERLYARHSKVHPQTIPSSMISAPASHVAMAFGVHGPAFVLASACASSAHALGEAMHMIHSGRVDVVIAGGTDACLTPGSWTAWSALGVLAPDTCRPFSRDRRGMVLGEGAAILVLESEAHARSRGATILGKLVGYGASTDAVHITAPDCEGFIRAIRAAYADADVDPASPALISTHGTGTLLNDAAEAQALRTFYGDGLKAHRAMATKSSHGHMIGATGAMEFLLGMMALREGMTLPVLHHLGPDDACDMVPLTLEPEEIGHRLLVSNSLAFGGLNAVLIGQAA